MTADPMLELAEKFWFNRDAHKTEYQSVAEFGRMVMEATNDLYLGFAPIGSQRQQEICQRVLERMAAEERTS